MSTPIADSTLYATSADFVALFDTRDVQQWVSDTGSPVSSGSLTSNTVLTNALATASGMLESACLCAQRYTVTDLQTIISNGGNSASYLKYIVCNLALWVLINRRPFIGRDMPAQVMEALQLLDDLRAGKRILAFAEVAQAGNPRVTTEALSDIQTRNLATNQASRFFGADRAQDFVPGYAPGAGSQNVP